MRRVKEVITVWSSVNHLLYDTIYGKRISYLDWCGKEVERINRAGGKAHVATKESKVGTLCCVRGGRG